MITPTYPGKWLFSLWGFDHLLVLYDHVSGFEFDEHLPSTALTLTPADAIKAATCQRQHSQRPHVACKTWLSVWTSPFLFKHVSHMPEVSVSIVWGWALAPGRGYTDTLRQITLSNLVWALYLGQVWASSQRFPFSWMVNFSSRDSDWHNAWAEADTQAVEAGRLFRLCRVATLKTVFFGEYL